MGQSLVKFQTGWAKDRFEEVAVSHSLEELGGQLSTLDLSLLKDKPVLVLLSAEDNFQIYSKI